MSIVGKVAKLCVVPEDFALHSRRLGSAIRQTPKEGDFSDDTAKGKVFDKRIYDVHDG